MPRVRGRQVLTPGRGALLQLKSFLAHNACGSGFADAQIPDQRDGLHYWPAAHRGGAVQNQVSLVTELPCRLRLVPFWLRCRRLWPLSEQLCHRRWLNRQGQG
jgi:hypothetical protein